MKPCKLVMIDGNAKCLNHRTFHYGTSAKIAVALTPKAEAIRQAWHRYFGYYEEEEAENTIPKNTSTTTTQPVSLIQELPVASQAGDGIVYRLKIVNRLEERISLWLKLEQTEENIVAILPNQTAVLEVAGGTAYVLRADDTAIMAVIPPVTEHVHKVVT